MDVTRAAPCHMTRSKPVWMQGRIRLGYHQPIAILLSENVVPQSRSKCV